MDQTFEQNFKAMVKSISSNRSYSTKVRAMMLPAYKHERDTHDLAARAGTSCSCRICYWAKDKRC